MYGCRYIGLLDNMQARLAFKIMNIDQDYKPIGLNKNFEYSH